MSNTSVNEVGFELTVKCVHDSDHMCHSAVVKPLPYLQTSVLICNISAVTETVESHNVTHRRKNSNDINFAATLEKINLFQHSKHRSAWLPVGQFPLSFSPVNIDFWSKQIQDQVLIFHCGLVLAAAGTPVQWCFVHSGNSKNMKWNSDFFKCEKGNMAASKSSVAATGL